MLEHLWNGWRMAYVVDAAERRDSDERSIFSQILSSEADDEAAGIVHRGERCFAILNAFPYATGHLLVLPYREVAELEELEPAEASELWATVTDAVRAVKRAYSPEGVNVGVNLGRAAGGSVVGHVHVHVVPRWVGDVNFMTAVANTRTLPEALGDTWRRVSDAWPPS